MQVVLFHLHLHLLPQYGVRDGVIEVILCISTPWGINKLSQNNNKPQILYGSIVKMWYSSVFWTVNSRGNVSYVICLNIPSQIELSLKRLFCGFTLSLTLSATIIF